MFKVCCTIITVGLVLGMITFGVLLYNAPQSNVSFGNHFEYVK